MADLKSDIDHPNRVLIKAREFQSESAFCDLVLVVDGEEFQVHKVIVAAASQYFRYLIQYDASPPSNFGKTSSGTSTAKQQPDNIESVNPTCYPSTTDTHHGDSLDAKSTDTNSPLNTKPDGSTISSCSTDVPQADIRPTLTMCTTITTDTQGNSSDTKSANTNSPSSNTQEDDLTSKPGGSTTASCSSATPQGASINSKVELKLPNLSCNTFKLVLDYIYSGVIRLNEDNVEDILIAADALMMEDLKAMCWSELGEHISLNNCIGMWVLAGRLGSQEMARSLSKYILKNFLDVYQGREFLKLAPNSLFSFLKQESLNIGHDLHSLTNISETVVLRAILRWVDHRKKSREPHLKRLLSTVRWAAIKKDGDEYKSILESTEWQTVIEESFQDTLKKKNPKLSRGSLDVMVVCGAGQSNYNVFFLPINPVTGTRMCMENLTYRRRGHSVIVTGGHMYVIGAGDSLETGHITQCERYDPKTNKWSAIAPLRYGRQNCKLAAINKKVYCLGGHGQYGFEADNEVYDIATNTWSSFPFIEMVTMRADSYIAALNNKLYYLSETGNPSSEPGFVAEEDACLEHPFRLVQCFDPATDKWSAKSPEFGEVKLPPGKVEDCIFVLNKERQFVYDTKRNTWEQLLAPMCGGIALALNGLNSLYDHIIRSSDSFYMLHSTGILQTSDPRLGEWELITPEGLPRDFPAANKDHTVILSVPTAMFVHSVTR